MHAGNLPVAADLEVAAACELEERDSGHFCLVADAADGGTFAILADVLGNGPLVARASAYLRSCCAAIAPRVSSPAQLLVAANQALLELPPGLRELASSVCLHYRPDGATVSWALAGHPSPFRIPELEPLDGRQPTSLLGIGRRPELETRTVELARGAGVVAFTAETIDTPRSRHRLGEEGLMAIVAVNLDRSAREVADRAHAAVVEWNGAGDQEEVCILVMRRAGDGD